MLVIRTHLSAAWNTCASTEGRRESRLAQTNTWNLLDVAPPVEVLTPLAAARLVAEDGEPRFDHGGVLVADKPTSDGEGDCSPRSLNISNKAKLADTIGGKGMINGFCDVSTKA